MRRLVLFSNPIETLRNELQNVIIPSSLPSPVFAYMPSDGGNCPPVYRDYWEEWAKERGADFLFVNNAQLPSPDDTERLLNATILLISGGNTFRLLHNVRENGYDKIILHFTQKESFVLAGFSAGAILFTPTIEVCNLPEVDENLDQVTDLRGLGLVPYELFPHYEARFEPDIQQYEQKKQRKVRRLRDDEYIVEEL